MTQRPPRPGLLDGPSHTWSYQHLGTATPGAPHPITTHPDDLINLWMWSFNHHQPDQGRIWVPHLAWAHTLVAPPTEPRPARSPGGRARAAPQLKANALNIPLPNGLAYWETGTAPKRGHNLQCDGERYAQTVGPQGRGAPSTVAMVVLENSHYYQVRMEPRTVERLSDLKAVDSMLPKDMDLSDGSTRLLPGQPPEKVKTGFHC